MQSKADVLDAEFRKEQAALEDKYNKLRDPLVTRRANIVSGAEPTAEETAEAKVSDKAAEDKDEKGIPDFWLETLKHHPQFESMITEDDERVLKHLKDIKLITNPIEGPSFSLEFVFEPNEFFEETSIKKDYHLKEDTEMNEIIFESVEATEITWKEGKNVTVKMVSRTVKVGGGRGGRGKGPKGGKGGKPQTKVITEEQPVPSFFNFFNPPSAEDFEEEEDGEEELQSILEEDYEMGCMIKEYIIPNAVNWFTGDVKLPDDMFGGYDMEDMEDDDEDGEGEDAEEYNSDEDDDFDGKSAPQAGGAQGANQPECKQQ